MSKNPNDKEKNRKPFKLESMKELNFDIENVHAKMKRKDDPSVYISRALDIVFRQMRATGRRPQTIKSYDYAMSNLMEITNIQFVHEIDTECLYKYIENIEVSVATKLIRLKAIKAVLSRFFDNGWLPYKFWTNIQIKVDHEVKKNAEKEDIELLLSLIDKTTFVGLRNAVAIMLMYKTGIRINTLGQLREQNIDFETLELSLDASIMKGRSFLKLPMDRQLSELIKRLISENNKVRKHSKTHNTFIFVTARGAGVNESGGTNTISKSISDYANRYDLKNINSQAIRRAYAKNLLLKGADVPLISKALGHQDLKTTTQYLHLSVNETSENLRGYL